MNQKLPSFIRVKYNRKLIITLAIVVLTIVSAILSILIVFNFGNNSSQSGIKLPSIEQYLWFVNSSPTQSPHPQPTLTSISPTPSVIVSITPPKLNITNPNTALDKLSTTIQDMKEENLSTIIIERFYTQAQNELEQGNKEKSLKLCQQGYELGQEMLLAQKYATDDSR